MKPSVSVVLAVYNASWCVERALDSVLAQTSPPLELIVCDDGSTDGTPDLIERRYASRVSVLRLPHRNASATRTVGLDAARGDWLAFLDADDWWEPVKLERQLARIERHPEVAVISSDGPYVSAEGVLRESWLADYFAPVTDMHGDLFPALVERCFPLLSSCMVRRDAYGAVGGMDPGIVYSHDYDLWLRLSARYPGELMADRLVNYWYHPGSLSRRYEGRHRDDLMLMERIARGELRDDPAARAAGRRRAAALAFDIGLLCLRSDRIAEARGLFRRASAAGPAKRRLLAACGTLVPGFAAPAVRRLGWLKRRVAGARATPGRLPGGGGGA